MPNQSFARLPGRMSRKFSPQSPLRVVSSTVTAAFLLLSTAAGALGQAVDYNLWVPNRQVDAVVRAGNTIYIGGTFTRVSPPTGSGAPVDSATGTLPPSFPKVVGRVFAVTADGAGGWFIGGQFITVGGLPRINLAHIEADLSVSAWNPGANDQVLVLLRNGSTLYAGGRFTVIGGLTRNRIAAFNTTSGAVIPWNPNANDVVLALHLTGTTMYVGGSFTAIGGQARNRIAALNSGTGTATAWNPNADGPVRALITASTFPGYVLVGGGFLNIGGQARARLAEISSSTGIANSWNPSADSDVNTIAVSGSNLYAGGSFKQIGGQGRSGLAAVNLYSGAATSWGPTPLTPGVIYAVALAGPILYVGGDFREWGAIGNPLNFVAAVSLQTGGATAWDPQPSSAVRAIAVSPGMVYVGGEFSGIGGEARNHLAALDATTGALTGWNPAADGEVRALGVSGSALYVGGDFVYVSGRIQRCMAAFDLTTGAILPFRPLAYGWQDDPYASVRCLAVAGPVVYAGGHFVNIGGQPRQNLAALDATTGAAIEWYGGGNNTVSALALSGSTLYAGGGFVYPTVGLAAFDAVSGVTRPWNPNLNSAVTSLAVSNSTLYAGGGFTSIGGQPRAYLAAFDLATGMATAWNPSPNKSVQALWLGGSTLYVGGNFTSIGGQARNSLAALDVVSGAATSWNAAIDDYAYNSVLSLYVSGPTVYGGGSFGSMGGLPRSNLAAVTEGGPTPVQVSLLSARAMPDGVELAWLAPAGDVTSATVERRTAVSDWRTLGDVLVDGMGRLVFYDTQVVPGARYGYRLGVMEEGRRIYRGETWVDVPVTPVLSMAGPRPNPSHVDLRIAFSLPDASAARLELFDLSGRRITTRDVGPFGAGSHVVSLAAGLPPGHYVVRLSHESRALEARVVVLP